MNEKFPNVGKDDLSEGIEAVPVSVEATDLTISDFEYSQHVKCGPGITIDCNKSLYPGCDCEGECNESSCSCIVRYSRNYDGEGRLFKGENKAGYCLPIFECNSNCTCRVLCTNRLSQQGIKVKLQVFRTENNGLGVRTLHSISRHRFICEYSGELVSYGEAKRRATKAREGGTNYMFVLKEHIADGKVLKTHIDATRIGNVARFFNHSCDPNMVMHPVRVNSPVPRLCLFASRDINRGEELTFSYGHETCRDNQSRSYDRQTTCSGGKPARTQCLCGSMDCAGYLPFDECLYQF